MTADQHDRHILLNKPFWSDYWASMHQYNMRRWNDGDSIPVNYVGHPMEGAIAGYIEIQNDPRGRSLIIGKDGRRYWNSRFRAFLWASLYSTQFEIGPISESTIFNQGGFTYPIRCEKDYTGPGGCENPNAVYTNNTGWVDFIITPTIGTLWIFGEDALDRFISDPLVRRYPHTFGYKFLRSGLNPNRSLANMLRGRYPWYRDYEHLSEYQSPAVVHFEQALDREPAEVADLNLFYSVLSLKTNHPGCIDCRNATTGAGAELGLRVRRYVDLVAIVRAQPSVSPIASMNIGGSLFAGNFGLRAGYSGEHVAVKASLAPGFASYSDTTSGRNFNFSALADLSVDLRFTSRFAVRATAEQMLIRYKSIYRDPPGIGTPPRLSFLSHDNYINSTNWGVRIGPVLRF